MSVTRMRLVLLVAIALAGSAGASEARPAALAKGLYTCYTGTFTYSGAIRLAADGRYAFSFGTRGAPPRTLLNPKWGRYRLSGTRLTFVGGPWGTHYGVVKTTRKVTIYLKGETYPYTWCNWRSA
jgi:hypothetical protein